MPKTHTEEKAQQFSPSCRASIDATARSCSRLRSIQRGSGAAQSIMFSFWHRRSSDNYKCSSSHFISSRCVTLYRIARQGTPGQAGQQTKKYRNSHEAEPRGNPSQHVRLLTMGRAARLINPKLGSGQSHQPHERESRPVKWCFLSRSGPATRL